MSTGTTTVYDTTVTAVGEQVPAFLEHGILIFFGDHAPAELHDISVLHRVTVCDDGPRPGDLVHLGEETLEVLAVGDVVRDNLLNLGHMDIKADGLTEAKLPGDVCVRKGPIPLLATGDAFRITRQENTPEQDHS
ncbi:PTS sorbitol transporter subunit IIA [Nocardioides oleivorans]|uniref:PTS sorbitol transporter subunit IIA n=1 Tax=Nocardioides oleivorans TaxID=273676 RepID=A0A4Q2RZE4_9ACTN|nr:PTS glucitol/sorbitol transporter subunit IIA [Nocardioides oleivorans]RYB93445.1 PTS sorbitol transporter subunit IIA [Nocardioides oleivorans]